MVFCPVCFLVASDEALAVSDKWVENHLNRMQVISRLFWNWNLEQMVRHYMPRPPEYSHPLWSQGDLGWSSSHPRDPDILLIVYR